MALTSETRDAAWIGDAVLGLFARECILRGELPAYALSRHELYVGLTCNQFLSAFGEPTSVEAHIGRLYETEGLAAANAWMRTHLLPHFTKQLHRRQRAGRR